MKKFKCVITSTKPDMNGVVISQEALEKFIGHKHPLHVNFDFSKPPVGEVKEIILINGELVAKGTLISEFLEEPGYVAPSFRIVESTLGENLEELILDLEPMSYGLVARHADDCATPVEEDK